MMRNLYQKSVLAMLLLMLMVSSAHAFEETLKEQARSSAKALGGALKQELQKSLKQSGPIAAIKVCTVKAPQIAAHISQTKGIRVGRTALRVRNPDNAPDEWEKKQLENFISRLASGEPVGKLEAHVIKNEEFRYMKAIGTQGVCINCHGATLSKQVHETIQMLYPKDQATGFAVGDIRGAFTITIPMKKTNE